MGNTKGQGRKQTPTTLKVQRGALTRTDGSQNGVSDDD